jgi:hypothetical protein
MNDLEDGDGGTRGARRWPDDIDDRILYEFASYHWELKRSLRAAAFGWPTASSDQRAAYLDGLAQLREKEQRAWETYLARPITKGNP